MADVDVESLELQITGDSKKATASLDALIETLGKLKKATEGGCGLDAVAKELSTLNNANTRVSSSNQKSTKSFASLATKVAGAYLALKKGASMIASWVSESNDYVENMNLFNVAMGQYATEAMDYANQVSEAMGIDTSEWIRAQGVFMTLATGFGVAGDRANTMSKQLTQLGYDISSFYNISASEAMSKLKSGLAGELEPLRSLGYDLSQAKLEATALSLGIDKAVSSMTQAEKAELRYYAIMTQVTQVQGDMARTLEDPANQLRIFNAQVNMAARSLGNIFIPALNAVLPYAIAAVKVIRYLADAIAGLFGWVIPEVDDSAYDGLGESADNASGSIDDANNNAKKLKKTLLGIDELNIASDTSGTSEDDSYGSGFNFNLPTYDFIDESVTSRVDEIVEKFKGWMGITGEIDSWADLFDTKLGDILTTVGAIGMGFAAWKISTGTLAAIESLKSLGGSATFTIGLVGVAAFIADLDKLKSYLEDYGENGATFSNVAGIISEFAGLIGDALLILGKVEYAGPLKVVQGVGEIISTINNMATNGVDVANILDVARGLTNVGIGIGAITKDLKVTAISLGLQGLLGIIGELQKNWDAIKKGDWSGVDKATLVISAIEVLGGIVTALKAFNAIKSAVNTTQTVKNITDAASTASTISTTTSTLTTKLTTLVKNLGLGIAIIAEVAAAAALIVGAIWLLGVELEQVGIAWEPVIANADTVAIAVGVGTGLLVAVGLATAALGTLGGAVCAQIGIGIAILAEIGVAAALFVAEIWAIGWGLDEVGKAWEPVLNNGENIATAIGIGTGVLVAIAVVAALLGVAATATAGTLPLAIGLGTAMLAEMGIAAGLFVLEIVAIGIGLAEVGDAWQPVLDKGETVEQGILQGTILLLAVGAATAALGVASVATVGLLPLAIAAGTKMLVEIGDAFDTLVDEMVDVAEKLADDLAPAMEDLNDDLPGLSEDMESFTDFMGDFAEKVVSFTVSSAIAGIAATIDKVVDFFTTDPIQRMSDEVAEQKGQMDTLVKNLEKTIPVIENADRLLGEFNDAMDGLKTTAGIKDGIGGKISRIITIGVSLAKEKWTSLASFIGNKLGVDISLNGDGWEKVKKWLGDKAHELKLKLPKIGVNWSEKEVLGFKISYPSGFYTYAQGGFPDVGEAFIAREAGPELVGTIGNKSAVVNNDQIVESVSKGVYRAVVQAMGQSGNQTVEAKVNDKVLFEVVVNRTRQETMRKGYNPLLGGV